MSTVDICIPAYNEEEVIQETCRAVLLVLRNIPGIRFQLVVVDNASTDATSLRASEVPGVSVLTIPEKGKGAAVVAAARASSADIFGFTDADLSADPRDFKKLLQAINEGADIAIGSRFADRKLVHRSFPRHFSSAVFNLLRKSLLGISVKDSQCGLKLMNTKGRNLLVQCEETGWFFDMELLARAERAHLLVKEIPIHWEEHRFKGRLSKLRLLTDSLGAIRAMFRIRARLAAHYL